jgi:uncharacterized protein (DUF983 family)
MKKKGSKFYSILNNKCPIYHEGDVFSSNLLNIKKFDKMHENCSVCNHKYEIEPGFFIGAMYVSYGITVAISVATSVLAYLIYPKTLYYMYMVYIALAIIIFIPFTYRLSRLIWINMFSSRKSSSKKQ